MRRMMRFADGVTIHVIDRRAHAINTRIFTAEELAYFHGYRDSEKPFPAPSREKMTFAEYMLENPHDA